MWKPLRAAWAFLSTESKWYLRNNLPSIFFTIPLNAPAYWAANDELSRDLSNDEIKALFAEPNSKLLQAAPVYGIKYIACAARGHDQSNINQNKLCPKC